MREQQGRVLEAFLPPFLATTLSFGLRAVDFSHGWEVNQRRLALLSRIMMFEMMMHDDTSFPAPFVVCDRMQFPPYFVWCSLCSLLCRGEGGCCHMFVLTLLRCCSPPFFHVFAARRVACANPTTEERVIMRTVCRLFCRWRFCAWGHVPRPVRFCIASCLSYCFVF